MVYLLNYTKLKKKTKWAFEVFLNPILQPCQQRIHDHFTSLTVSVVAIFPLMSNTQVILPVMLPQA